MKNPRKSLSELDWDGWIILLSGILAIIIALLDFSQVVVLSTSDSLRLIIVALGVMLAAIAAQTSRRAADIRELGDVVGATSTELINSSEFELHVMTKAMTARSFILDTSLNAERASLTHPLDRNHHYYNVIFERLRSNEISYRRVETIFNRERLFYVISRLLYHENMDYYVRYYDSPPKAIPVLNMIGIDNDSYYLGKFYTSDAPADKASAIYIRNSDTNNLLSSYWDTLWNLATPLNEGGRIDWDELTAISTRLGVSDDEFDSTVRKLKRDARNRVKDSS
ncbi:MAG: hypothetical protein AAF702_37470 [Chloroflexota bacterium]